MGAEPPAPWSRWDGPGVTYNPPPLISQPFGDTGGNGNPFAQPFLGTTRQPRFIQGVFTRQDDDPTSRDYLRCYYSDANNPRAIEVFEQCARSVGCCPTTCCVDTSWEVKYAWAIALVIIFGIIVIVAVIVWLACWCFNRTKDKTQKQELLSSTAPSAAQSQVSGGYPASVNNGYYPYVGGPYAGGPSKYNGRF